MGTRSQAPKLIVPVGERDHISGELTAPVTLVEYGDFECTDCGHAYPIVKEIQERLGDRLCFVYRYFPMATIHPHARHAAEAAEIAAKQGKFWQMHDYLFENQMELDDDSLKRYADNLGLDMKQFNREFDEHVYAARVREDFMSGMRSGVNGTPTFYINGVRYDESWDAESLFEALESAAAQR